MRVHVPHCCLPVFLPATPTTGKAGVLLLKRVDVQNLKKNKKMQKKA
jgi:hypothetical protein